MESIFLVFGLGIMAFTATNIDDLFILVMFFSNPNFSIRQVVIGQYIGVSLLIAISGVSYFAALIIPSAWIGLMGIFPIIIGLKNLAKLKNNKKQNEEYKGKFLSHINTKIVTVAIISFANGGDNIGVYVPLFASSNSYQMLFLIIVFLLMIGVWCVIGYYLVNNKIVGKRIRKYGHILLPFVLIALGIFILIKCETFSLLW
mgnify:CR=1 FL=1